MKTLVFCIGFGLLSGAVCAQGQGVKLYREGQFDESTVIQALKPPMVERSIVIGRPKPRPMAGQPGSATMPLLITFETNSAELTDSARHNLDIVARALASDNLSQLSFTVEGHADPRGTRELNQHLSQARAESVVDYLAQSHGIARDRLQPQGRGDAEPFKPDVPAAPENRRVIIKTNLSRAQ